MTGVYTVNKLWFFQKGHLLICCVSSPTKPTSKEGNGDGFDQIVCPWKRNYCILHARSPLFDLPASVFLVHHILSLHTLLIEV